MRLLCFFALFSLTLGFNVTCVPPIVVDLHSDATLRCCVNPPQDLTSEFVKWFVKVKTKDTKIVYARNNGDDHGLDQHSQYKNRTEIVVEDLKRGNISLIIHNVTEDDAAVYHLTVEIKDQIQNPTQYQTRMSNVTLTVRPKGHDMGQGDKDHKDPDVREQGAKTEIGKWIGIGIVIVIVIVIIGAVLIPKFKHKCRRSNQRQVPNHDQQATNQELEQLNRDQQATNQELDSLDQDQQATNQEEEPLD